MTRHNGLPTSALAGLLVALATLGQACEGSELYRPIDRADVTAPDITPDTADVPDTDLPAPVLEFQVRLESGPVGRADAALLLDPADELTAYAEVPGFQVDVDYFATGEGLAGTMRLVVGGSVVAQEGVAAFDDDGLSPAGTFRGVTLPTSSEPLVVRVEYVVAAVVVSETSKDITFVSGPACELSLTVGEVALDDGEAVCVLPLNLPNPVGPTDFGIAYTVALLSGECTRVTGTITGHDGEVLAELDEALDGDDQLTGTVRLGSPGDAVEVVVGFGLSAIHPSAPSRNGRLEREVRVDNVPPPVDFIAPDPSGQPVISIEDDAVPGVEGIQFTTVGGTTADDAASATLSRDGEPAGALDAIGGEGTFFFDTLTFTENGSVTLAIALTDRCGNVGTAEIEALVLATPGSVAFVSPGPGAVLLAVDDADPETPLVYETTMTLAISGVTAAGSVTITCDEVDVGSLDYDEASEDGRYAVPVAIDVAALGNEVSCTARTDLGESASPIALTVALPAPTLALTAPRDEEEVEPVCFNSSDVAVSLVGEGLDGQAVTWAAGEVEGTAGVIDAGALEGLVSLPADVADGAVTLTFDAVDVFGNRVSSTQEPPEVTIRIDRTAPQLVFDLPEVATIDASLIPDAEPDLPGYHVALGGSVTDTILAGQVCVLAEGGPCAEVGANGRWAMSLRLSRGDNLVIVQATDDCGNTSPQVSRIITLVQDLDVLIEAPTDGATLLAADDGDPETPLIYETTFDVRLSAAVAGDTLVVLCGPAAEGASPVSVGSVALAEPLPADGLFSVEVAIPVATTGQEARCFAEQRGEETLVSNVIALRVGLPAPTLTLNAPVDGACVNADTLDVAGATTGLDGSAVAVAIGALDLSALAAVDGGAFTAPFDLSAAPDGGPYALEASAEDGFGNPVSAGAAFTIDRSAPVLALISPPLTIDTTELQDASPAPGFQRDVVIAIEDDSLVGAELCLVVDDEPFGCAAPSGETVTFSNVTFQPGENLLVISGRDGCGNDAEALALTIVVLTDPPVVRIIGPDQNLVTVASVIDIVALALEPDNTPISGGEARLFIDGQESAIAAESDGEGTFTFPAVPLSPGETASFVVEVTRDLVTGASGPRTVRQKDVAPEIAITTPAAGTINAASAFCEGSGSDCTLSVVASTTEVEDGSQAGLSVTCDGVPVSYSAVAGGGEVLFAGVTLPDGATCELVATVTDAAGQEETSEEVLVVVDRTPPSIAFVDLPSILQANSDLDPGTPGIQAPLVVAVSGAEAGNNIAISLGWVAAGEPQSRQYTLTVIEGETEYAAEDVAGAGFITWPEGLVTVEAAVSDDAGNPAEVSRTVTVNSTASVAIASPADTAATCDASCADGVCFEGACWRGWGAGSARLLQANVAGLQSSGQNLRVCSDHPSLAGQGAPECASAPSVTGAYRQVLLQSGVNGANLLNLGAALPEGYQRLVVEALPLSAGGWVTSLNAANAAQRLRRIFLDLAAPVVSTVFSPSDTLEPIGYLNAAEQEATPRVFALSFDTTKAGTAQVVVNGNVVATAPAVAGTNVLDVTLPSGSLTVWIIVTDAVGNASPATPGQGAVTYSVIVDVTPPTLSFTRPTSSPLNGSSNLDVTLASNAQGRFVSLFDDGVFVASAEVISGVASFPHADFGVLSDGEHRLTARVTDVAGNERVAATSPAVILVDTIPPEVSLVAPIDNAQLSDGDDADPASSGYQLDVSFGTAAGATSWTISTEANCDIDFANCGAPAQQAAGGVTNPGGLEPTRRINAPISGPTSRFRVLVRAEDAAGNAATVSHRVTVTLSDCQIVFTDLPSGDFFNATYCADGISCSEASFGVGIGTFGFCVATTVELLVDGAVEAAAPLAGFGGSLPLALSDARTVDLQARLRLATETVVATPVVTRTTDFTPPGVRFVAQDVDGFSTPGEGQTLIFNTMSDLDPNAPGMQLHAAVEVDDTHAAGGSLTHLEADSGAGPVVLVPGNVALPLTLAGPNPVVSVLRDLTLGDGATWTVEARAVDAAGNPGVATFTGVVDVTPPAPVAITDIGYDKRRPQVTPLSWVAVGDNGLEDGPVADYAVRYSTQPIDANNWDEACDFLDIYGSPPMPEPEAPGEAMTAAVGGPDSRGLAEACKLEIRFQTNEEPQDPGLYVAIRAVDAAGNLSALGGGSVAVLTNADLWLELRRLVFDNTDGDLGFNPAWIAGSGANLRDINGDGVSDVGLGVGLANAACVVLGHDFPEPPQVITTPSGALHSCLTPAGAATIIPGTFRVGGQVVSLGDVNGDGLWDFGITARREWTAPYEGNPNLEAMLFVYLGRESATAPDLLAPDVVLRGLTSQSANANLAYVSACGLGDVSGDGVEDIGVGEPSRSLFHAIPGSAAWETAGAGGPLVIDLAAAGGIEAAGGISFSMPVTNGTPLFGGRCGRAGDLIPTPEGQGSQGLGDMLVSAAGTENGRLFVLPGRTFAAGSVYTLTQNLGANPTAEDQVSLRLRQELAGQQNNSVFGVDFQGGVDATGDGVPDVLGLTSNRSLSQGLDGKALYVFDGARLADLLGTDVRVQIGANPQVGEGWVGANGWVLRSSVPARFGVTRLLSSFTGQTFSPADFEPPHLMHAGVSSDALQLRVNHLDPDEDYALGQFPVYDGDAFNIFNAGGFSLGVWVSGGMDFTGDGLPDVISGTNTSSLVIIR